MNTSLIAAGILIALIGLAHSIIGEIKIFNGLRGDRWAARSAWIPTQGGTALREFQVRIIWASWHVVSVLGWALAALLLQAGGVMLMPLPQLTNLASIIALTVSAALVLIGTRGKHPAWIALLIAAGLIVWA
jgi:hypothetical protein